MIDERGNSDLQELAQLNIWRTPMVNVLDVARMEQYSFLITAVDSVLQGKLKNRTLMLPELREHGNETIGVYSDYGGEAPTSRYFTYSFLVCGYNHSYGFPGEVANVRRKYKLGDQEIAFKNFRFGPMLRALPDYLRILDFLVVGLLITIVVDKRINSFFSSGAAELQVIAETLEKEGLGRWKPRSAEKLLRVVHVISYFVALLSKDGQKVFWMTDNDAIAPNEDKHRALLRVLQRVLRVYTGKSFAHIGGATPFERDGVGFTDFLSSTDIAAGAVEQYFTRRDADSDEVLVKDGADTVLKWLCHDGIGLKKLNVLIEKKDDGVMASEIVFSEREEVQNAVKVYVPVRY